jgi:hypothetical protein
LRRVGLSHGLFQFVDNDRGGLHAIEAEAARLALVALKG